MTTDSDDKQLLFWEQRIKASRWMIFKTCVWGVLAAILGVAGQGWLESASPLFPIISQNYGLWQSGYLLALLAIFILWAVAMHHKIALLDNSRQGKAKLLRIAEQNQRRAQQKQDARERREAEQRALDELKRTASPSYQAKRRSTKFDY